MKYILLIFIIFISSQIKAGNEVGNGGDIVKCPKKAPMLLDYYQIDLTKMKITLENDPKALAAELLKDFAIIDPKLAIQYQLRLKNIWSEIEFKKKIYLTDIADSLNLHLPRGCKIEQIAIRKKQVLPGQKRFLVNHDLWSKMTPMHQAGLLLHEIIYEHFSFLGEKKSVKARYFNAFLLKSHLNNKQKIPYKEMLQKMKIPIYR